MTRLHHAIGEDHPHLNSEKGFQHAPLKLPFIDHTASCCTLAHLLEAWHDSEGLCRAIDQVRPCLVLMLDRHVGGLSIKCLQKVELDSGVIHIPCFDDSGQVTHQPFLLCAVGYHIGNTPNSGHYRSALRYQGIWLIYDDNKPPDKMDTLSDHILQNANLYWLVRLCPAVDRTLNERTQRFLTPSASRSSGPTPPPDRTEDPASTGGTTAECDSCPTTGTGSTPESSATIAAAPELSTNPEGCFSSISEETLGSFLAWFWN